MWVELWEGRGVSHGGDARAGCELLGEGLGWGWGWRVEGRGERGEGRGGLYS